MGGNDKVTLLTMVHEGCLTVMVVIDSAKPSVLETSAMSLFIIRNKLSQLKKTYLGLNVFFILSLFMS